MYLCGQGEWLIIDTHFVTYICVSNAKSNLKEHIDAVGTTICKYAFHIRLNGLLKTYLNI